MCVKANEVNNSSWAPGGVALTLGFKWVLRLNNNECCGWAGPMWPRRLL